MKSVLYVVAIYLNAFRGESEHFSLHKIIKVIALRQLICVLTQLSSQMKDLFIVHIVVP